MDHDSSEIRSAKTSSILGARSKPVNWSWGVSSRVALRFSMASLVTTPVPHARSKKVMGEGWDARFIWVRRVRPKAPVVNSACL